MTTKNEFKKALRLLSKVANYIDVDEQKNVKALFKLAGSKEALKEVKKMSPIEFQDFMVNNVWR